MIPKDFPFTAHPKRTRTLLQFLLLLGFVAVGIWMIRRGHSDGWFVAGGFGLGIPIALLQFHRRCSYLAVDWDGIEYCALFRTTRIPWSDIGEFGVIVDRPYGIVISRSVGINFSATSPHRGKRRTVVRMLTGYDATLPDTYGFAAGELVKLLSACRAAMLARESDADASTALDNAVVDDE